MSNSETKSSVFKGTAIVGGMTLVSRILGFLRDLLFARLFGAGAVADAFFVAFRIPNLLRSVMAEGALTSGFVPTFTDELAKGKSQAQAAISQISGFLLISTIILSAFGIFWAPEIIILFAPGFQTSIDKLNLSSELLQIMFPYLIFVSLVSMVGGALNSVRIYGTAAFAQVMMNVVFIIGILLAMLADFESAPYIVAWSTILGGAVQVLVQLPTLKRAGFNIWPTINLMAPAVRTTAKLMLPAIFGAAIYQLTIFVNTIFASVVGEGAISALFYADRVVQFPLGIYSIALASVLLPVLSNAVSQKDGDVFRRHILDSLRFTSFIIIPVSGFLALFALPIVELLFVRGQFDQSDAARVALAIQAYALGLWGTSCHTMAVRAFIAKKDTATPVFIGILTLATTIIFSLIFIGPITIMTAGGLDNILLLIQSHTMLGDLAENYELGHAGIALASSIAGTISFLVILSILKLRDPLLDLTNFIRSSILIVLVTVFIVETVGIITTGVITQVAVSIVLFAALCHLLKIREFNETLAVAQRLLEGRR